jgi:hypothetical protein
VRGTSLHPTFYYTRAGASVSLSSDPVESNKAKKNKNPHSANGNKFHTIRKSNKFQVQSILSRNPSNSTQETLTPLKRLTAISLTLTKITQTTMPMRVKYHAIFAVRCKHMPSLILILTYASIGKFNVNIVRRTIPSH